MNSPAGGVLTTVQAGRAIAATVVVLAHAATISGFGGSVFRAGHAGVDFFFVLSGFIILTVHAKDIGAPGRLASYVRRRLGRIFPPYWAASVIAMALAAAGVVNAVNGGLHRFVGLALLQVALLLPSHAGPVLGVGWTLEHEMLFYLVFATLILNRKLGCALMAAWLAWCVMVAMAFPLPAFPWAPNRLLIDFLGSSYHLQFGAGMLVAHVLARGKLPRPLAIASAGLACFACTAAADDAGVIDGLGHSARLLYGVASAAMLAGIVQAERNGKLDAPRWLVFLGEASYSIYLVHVALLMVVALAWRAPPSFATFAALACSGLLGGCVMHALVERPLLAALQQKSARSTAAVRL